MLREEERYRLLVNAVTDYAIYMLDPAGIVSSWNAGAERFKGYKAEEVIGCHFSRFYTEQDQASGLPAHGLRMAVENGHFENEGWRVRKDGRRFWAHVVIDPIVQPDGELIGYAKITRDLTERRQAEQELRKSEQQFRLLVQGVTDYAIYLLDPQGYVTSWNLGAQKIKGYQPEEIIGQHFRCFYRPEDQARSLPENSLATAIRDGRFEQEGWRVRKDGTAFMAHVVIDTIRDPDGSLAGFAKVTRDITERREAQKALDEAREILFQAQKMDALGQLTGGIAHDFNNLLTIILMSLALARKRLPEDSRSLHFIENAAAGAERGAVLTKRLLSFARRQQLRLEPVALPELIEGMDGLLRSAGPTLDIEAHFSEPLPLVLVDGHHLENALLNLVVNARDAMRERGVIRISAELLESDATCGLPAGQYVCLAVTDTGAGMDKTTLVKATEPFFTTKGVGKGTGLGLSMVHGLMEQSGGRLQLSSEPGKGTRVELWLPVASDAVVTEKQHADTPAATRSLVILAVDDDRLVLVNTRAMLEELGHRVIEADSAEQALALLRHSVVDLVISDQAMPGMTGAQLAEVIRRKWPRLPVIIASGYGELPEHQDKDGALLALAKPYDEHDLRQAIAELCASVGL